MRFVGIDIASEKHVVAALDSSQEVLFKPTPFTEDGEGYAQLFALLGDPKDTLVVMEATGHYWKNVCAALIARNFAVALLNPLRTSRFAGEDLERTKTDAIDAMAIARFAVQKRLGPTRLPDALTDELRELVRHRDRLCQMLGDRVRQLHRVVDLGFPEFTRHVKNLDTELALTLLSAFPNAEAVRAASVKKLATLRYGSKHSVGAELAQALFTSAMTSVGAHHGPAYRLQVQHACEDIQTLKRRLRELDRDIARQMEDHQVATLLTTIDGIGPQTAARLVAELGDPAEFRNAGALAAYVGVVPATRQSGKWTSTRAGITPLGNARLRHALWMPTLAAIRSNPWINAYYQGLRARGKRPKVAIIAAMRKLLVAVYTVAKNRKAFIPQLAGSPA